MRYPLRIVRLISWLLTCSPTEVYAQAIAQTAPQVTFKDRVFTSILRSYIAQKKAKAVKISIEQRGKSYWSSLSTAAYYENIADFPATAWAQWQNCLLVFYADQAVLDRMCTIIQPADSVSLLVHLQHILPDDRPPLPKADKREYFRYRYIDEPAWVFQIEGGREMWFSVDGGYNPQVDVPDSLPPVPEARGKP